MKTFKQLIAEVAQPKSEDELNFKQKHAIEVIDHPASLETQHSSEKVSKSRRADYKSDDSSAVYEEKKLDPVGKEDGDIDNDGDKDDSDDYLHARRKAIAKAMKEALVHEKKLDPVGKEDGDIDNDGDKDSSDEYLHARRKAISKAMKKESDELSEVSQNTLRNYMDKAGKDRLSKSKEAAQHFSKAGMTGSAKDTAKGMDAAKVANKRAKGYEMAFGKNLEKSMKKEASETSPYAIGMASAMKQTGDKPPLKKSTITKAHKIAKSIEKNESLQEANEKKIIADLNAGKSIDVIVQNSLNRKGDNKDEILKVIRDYNWNKRMKKEDVSFGEAVAGPQDCWPGYRKVGTKMGTGRNAGKRVNDCEKIGESEDFGLTENFKVGAVKLGDGSSVIIKEQDAKLLNQLVKELSGPNKEAMMKAAMKDKKGFNEILGFAKEAL